MAPQFRPPLRLHDRCQVRIDRIGREALPVIVIDDFLDNARSLIEIAAGGPGFRLSPEIYPGMRSPIPAPYPLALHGFLAGMIGEVFGLGALGVIDSRAEFSVVTKRPDQVAPNKRVPHTDTADPNFIVVLHYLCHPRHGGTSFYRHRATGFESAPGDRLPLYSQAIDAELALAEPADYIDGPTEHFERIAHYEAAFNRALVYRGVNVHAAHIARDYAYDPDPRTGRLTANTLFWFGQPLSRPLRAPREAAPATLAPGPWITTLPLPKRP